MLSNEHLSLGFSRPLGGDSMDKFEFDKSLILTYVVFIA